LQKNDPMGQFATLTDEVAGELAAHPGPVAQKTKILAAAGE